ncbi:uncharacterized protein [Bemisia tabaci]|uniref:uncharacterized protein n=1 Tax=Bemisia tabaci TaxID=7038 RepID=UPI003B28C96B
MGKAAIITLALLKTSYLLSSFLEVHAADSLPQYTQAPNTCPNDTFSCVYCAPTSLRIVNALLLIGGASDVVVKKAVEQVQAVNAVLCSYANPKVSCQACAKGVEVADNGNSLKAITEIITAAIPNAKTEGIALSGKLAYVTTVGECCSSNPKTDVMLRQLNTQYLRGRNFTAQSCTYVNCSTNSYVCGSQCSSSTYGDDITGTANN